MKLKLVLLALFPLSLFAQPPCVPGMPPIFYTLDMENDGSATFDLAYYKNNILIPEVESLYKASSSGYIITCLNNQSQPLSSLYTNVAQWEDVAYNFEYSGSGPLFVPEPGGCSINPKFFYYYIALFAVPYNEDMDNDGILNIQEDTNGNMNLMDDDSDHDGIINLLDTTTLSAQSFESIDFAIYPMPITNGIVNIQTENTIKEIKLYDLVGKEILSSNYTNTLDVSAVTKGTYVLKLSNDAKVFYSKISIN